MANRGPFIAVLALLAAGTFAGVTRAQEVNDDEAYAPLRVVGIMSDTGQALMWDEVSGEYRLVKVGDTLQGWKVTEVAAKERRVSVLGQNGMRDDLALTRLPRPG